MDLHYHPYKIQIVYELVIPRWPTHTHTHTQTQPWYLLFISLLTALLIFSPGKNFLLSPCRAIKHPLAAKLSLIVGKLSGRHT